MQNVSFDKQRESPPPPHEISISTVHCIELSRKDSNLGGNGGGGKDSFQHLKNFGFKGTNFYIGMKHTSMFILCI